MNTTAVKLFQQTVLNFYDQHGRHDLLWRHPEANGQFDPYKILVSELMLQQTQVSRVTPKFQQFLTIFPTVEVLAQADLAAVLGAWSGLGYNRRAKYLWQAAQKLQRDFNGQLPADQTTLTELPGVGVNTAGAIMAYAFNAPVVFIETNIRTVYLYHFFKGQTAVSDQALRIVVADSLLEAEPRVWYWALMDYGSALKRQESTINHASQSYAKQSSFHGSRRQLRGHIIKSLTEQPRSFDQLADRLPDERLAAVLKDLLAEELIKYAAGHYHL